MNNQKLLETVADIAYQSAQLKFYSGDSRSDISEFVRWAMQFEKLHSKTDWNENDYILSIEKFTIEKITDAKACTSR
jgi:hypothetical protein